MAQQRFTLRPTAAAWDWQEAAACRGMDSSAFYSPDWERGIAKRERERRAKLVCAGCPVQIECAEFAREIGEKNGVWGGLTAQELAASAPARQVSSRIGAAVGDFGYEWKTAI